MIKTEMYCEICGTKFYSEYGIGGHIDHCTNFSNLTNRRIIGKTTEDAFHEITHHGNELRGIGDIKTRLNCFLKWPSASEEVKNETKRMVEFLIEKMKKAEQDAEEIVSGKTMLERRFIVKAANVWGQCPEGDEDDKLMEGFCEELV